MTHRLQLARKLTDDRFPLLAGRIAAELKHLKSRSEPTTSRDHVIELMKANPWHFDDLLRSKRKLHADLGSKVFESKEPGPQYIIYECDVSIIEAYIRLKEYVYFRLVSASDERFARIYAQHFDAKASSEHTRAVAMDAKRFFAFPPALMSEPLWNHWLSLAAWTEEEAVVLTLGRNPDFVSIKTVEEELRLEPGRPSAFFDTLKQRTRALERAVASKAIKTLTPASVASWARKSLFEIPNRLQYFEEGQILVGEKSNTDDMDPKNRASLRLMILCMAIQKFQHKFDGNSPATTKITNAMNELGVSLNRDTVKDVLTDAANDPALAEHLNQIRKAMASK